MLLLCCRSLPKSLERYSAYMMLRAMFGNDPRLLEPSPEAIAKLTLEGVQDAVTRQLLSGHMEVGCPLPAGSGRWLACPALPCPALPRTQPSLLLCAQDSARTAATGACASPCAGTGSVEWWQAQA